MESDQDHEKSNNENDDNWTKNKEQNDSLHKWKTF